ncbi:unnamed protein product [Rangifer tarandus platyrhynchus]|uniref:Uncharacterized protein n=1 Tax=Rangifer tarandus platyrhynchus TaxID=3082113 RepID=A0AC59ZXH4_RANTA
MKESEESSVFERAAYRKMAMGVTLTPPQEKYSNLTLLPPLIYICCKCLQERRSFKISLSILVVTKAVLPCSPVLWTSVLLATWEIVLRDKPPCFRAFRHDTNQTIGGNCTDKRITWASRPDENLALQIYPVVITHDGNYTCQRVTSDGNFHHEYHLQVLVPPEVTLDQTENGTAVCKAAARKPAAQISWTPESDCVTEQEPYWGDGTVTVQSTCRWGATM